MNTELIKIIAKQKGISITLLASKIGCTYQHFYKIINGENIRVRTLEKIAEELCVPVSTFFEKEYEADKSTKQDFESRLSAVENVLKSFKLL